MTTQPPRTNCELCDAQTSDLAICWDCLNTFRKLLMRIVGETRSTSSPFDHERQLGLAAELELAATRQHVRASNRGGRSGEQERPFPVDLRAAQARIRLGTALDEALEYIGVVAADGAPKLEDAAHLLAGMLGVLRRHRGAAQHIEAVRDAVDRAENVLEPLRLVYVGPCSTEGCDGHLRAEAGASLAQCPTCTVWRDVATTRTAFATAAASKLLTAHDIARALTAGNGQAVELGTVRQWINRGLLIPATRTGSGKPVYRVSDAQALVARMAARRGQSAKG